MDLFDNINKRKACRTYSGQPFGQERLDEISEALAGFQPLYPGIALEWRLAQEMKGFFKVDAPYYLIISGQGREGEAENAGFIGQQLTLWFNHHGIGSVWLGGSKDAQALSAEQDIIAIAFGEPAGPIQREISEFKRKPIEEITNAPEDPCIQAVHLAPSGLNLQPWYLEKTQGKVLLYRQILRPPVSLFYKLSEVDLGIALCHYALACEHLGKEFTFTRHDAKGNKKGFRLFGELTE